MTPETTHTTSLKPLSSADVAVAVNVGRRLCRGEIDAMTALRWLQGWVSSTKDDDDEPGAFVLPGWIGAALPGWIEPPW